MPLMQPTGNRVWLTPFVTGDSVISSPAVANGIVYVGSNDGKIYAVDAGNKTEYWNYTTQAVAVRNWIYSSPAVANGVVYIGGGEGNTNLYAIGNQSAVIQAPFAAFTSDVRNGTAPLTVQFTNQSTGTHPMTYAWDFNNDGTIDNTTPSPSYIYDTEGVYTVNLTVTNGAGSDSEVKPAWINATAGPVTPVTNKTTNIGVFRPSARQFIFNTTPVTTGYLWAEHRYPDYRGLEWR